MRNVRDDRIKDIYRQMGPYDHYAHVDPENDSEAEKCLALDFDVRKSGALYRG
jgi:hypothetical protein